MEAEEAGHQNAYADYAGAERVDGRESNLNLKHSTGVTGFT
jgi:hypothetical protein